MEKWNIKMNKLQIEKSDSNLSDIYKKEIRDSRIFVSNLKAIKTKSNTKEIRNTKSGVSVI